MTAKFTAYNKVNYILLADDDEDDQRIFEDAILEADLDIKFEIANNGIILMALLNSVMTILPDILFLDINMPKKDGLQCLDEIRQNKMLDSMPVIIYSTSSYPPNIEETFRKGANLYFMKPNSFTKLAGDIKQILKLDWNKHVPYHNFDQFVFTQNLIKD